MGRNYENKNSEYVIGTKIGAPMFFAFLVTMLMVVFIYHKEIASWLYAHEMWLIPIQFNY